MMLDLLKPLAELEETLREDDDIEMRRVADKLTAVRAQVEREIAALQRENHRLKLNLVAPAIQDRLERQEAELSKLRSQLELLTTPKGGVCPNCLQALPEAKE